MSGRAKGKLFVIRGKERLDVGLQEDEFLLQAVFYCMVGPNPACRPSMLAPPRRQSLIPPLDHANSPAQIPPAGRPCWRPPPSKPYPTAGPRQQAGPNPACRLSMLALPRWQNLTPPLDHANRPTRIPPGSRPCWRLSAGNALCHRWVTPTGRPKSRPAAVHVGAPPLAKPYATVGPRQQAGPNPACRPPMLAPRRRQSLISPSCHANRPAQIPFAGRPCWRPSAGKTLSHRRTTLTGRPESRLPGAHVGVVRLRRDSFLYGNL